MSCLTLCSLQLTPLNAYPAQDPNLEQCESVFRDLAVRELGTRNCFPNPDEQGTHSIVRQVLLLGMIGLVFF